MSELKTPFPFRCRFCDRATTINVGDYTHRWAESGLDDSSLGTSLGVPRRFAFELHFIRCPNPHCHRVSAVLTLLANRFVGSQVGPKREAWDHVASRSLIPQSNAKVLPEELVPQAVREDYAEACSIESLSPKAASTLARRAIQGMIRHVFGISKPTLYEEIKALQENPGVHPDTWNAIDGVRHTGNIGAHMKKNINEIVDVDPDEARALIQLVEALVDDWYVTPHKRKQLMAKVTAIGDAKADATGKPKRRHPGSGAPDAPALDAGEASSTERGEEA